MCLLLRKLSLFPPHNANGYPKFGSIGYTWYSKGRPFVSSRCCVEWKIILSESNAAATQTFHLDVFAKF